MHRGHLAVARGILGAKLADEVWLMPCRRNPLKDGSTTMADDERLHMLRKAADYYNSRETDGRLKITDIELAMPEPSYTCDTLRRLCRENPDTEFRIAVGADSYMEFGKWKEWEWIEGNFRPIVYPRPGYEIGEVRPQWTLLEGVEEVDVSSTRIREKMRNGEPLAEEMPWECKSKTK